MTVGKAFSFVAGVATMAALKLVETEHYALAALTVAIVAWDVAIALSHD